jgi:undecaprenyl-diphosphatase
MSSSLLSRIDARDRALFTRIMHRGSGVRPLRPIWLALTHLGGARATISLCVLSVAVHRVTFGIAWKALVALGISHALVQVVKRSAVRERPSLRLSIDALIHEPDSFSFPSGHSCAAMAVAASFAWVFPLAAVPLLGLAFLIGLSRVMLGVHYPGDVVVGQAIALLTTYAVFTFS